MSTTHINELTEPNAKSKAGLLLETISLRDYFAAKVVQGLWANATALAQMPAGTEAESIASVAYDVADAMLKERSK